MLAAAAAATLAGCAPDIQQGAGRRPSASPSRSAPTLMPSPPEPTSSLSSSPSPSPPSPPAPPTREEIVADFGNQAPAQWGLEVDGVVLRSNASSICLTFDACGGRHGSGFDEELITMLVDTSTPATLFLNSRWIEANPQTTRDLAANPLFELANHGTTHAPLSVNGQKAYGITGTASVGEVHDEIMQNQVKLTSLLAEPPRFFRSGTAHYDDVAVRVVHALGLVPVNFDINSDAGATFTSSQVRAATQGASEGSICIGHFNQPGSGTAAGMAEAMVALKAGGATFTRLGDVLGPPDEQ